MHWWCALLCVAPFRHTAVAFWRAFRVLPLASPHEYTHFYPLRDRVLLQPVHPFIHVPLPHLD